MEMLRTGLPALCFVLCLGGCVSGRLASVEQFTNYTLDYTTPVDAALQARVEAIDSALRAKYEITPDQTAVGVLDLAKLRLALVNPDRMEYGASVPKIGILLAYFRLHPEAATALDPQIRHELGLMIKVSSNEIAAKYSQQLGLKAIQEVLSSYGFYDIHHGGGLWVGKHYGVTGERIGDPLGDNSHAATVRQVMRYLLLLEQGKLVSPAASRTMREIFASPEIRHRNDSFVKGLAGRPVDILRKSGWWEDWRHDAAIVTGPGRHYILVALTRTPKGDPYLEDLAGAVDDLVK